MFAQNQQGGYSIPALHPPPIALLQRQDLPFQTKFHAGFLNIESCHNFGCSAGLR